MPVFGYMTKQEALNTGFTHHGRYFGIPLWVASEGIPPDRMFAAATKWAPLEYLMTFFHYIEDALRPLMFPDEEPAFQFLVGERIK